MTPANERNYVTLEARGFFDIQTNRIREIKQEKPDVPPQFLCPPYLARQRMRILRILPLVVCLCICRCLVGVVLIIEPCDIWRHTICTIRTLISRVRNGAPVPKVVFVVKAIGLNYLCQIEANPTLLVRTRPKF